MTHRWNRAEASGGERFAIQRLVLHRCLAGCALLCAMWVWQPPLAAARREATFGYPISRVWTAAVRLVRVDLECPINEKDRDDGYFFFDYTDRGKTYPGSVELVSVQDSGGDHVRVIVQVPAMPAYVEAMILDKLGRKLEQEFGPPKAAKEPAQKKPDDDDAAKNDKQGAAQPPSGKPKGQ
jgi:hypothetical protein